MTKVLTIVLLGLLLPCLTSDAIRIFAKQITFPTWSTRLINAVTRITREVSNLQNFVRADFVSQDHTPSCFACEIVVDAALKFVRFNSRFSRSSDFQYPILAYKIVSVCSLFQARQVCEGFVNLNLEVLIYIARANPSLRSQKICSIVLQSLNCPDSNRRNWKIDLPPRTNVPRVPESFGPTQNLKILHLTDTHYDSNYQIGSNAACKEPLCCQYGTKPKTPKDAAGQWGDYRSCDTPWHVFDNTLDQITRRHRDVDFVYFTGDIIDHKIWNSSMNTNREKVSKILNRMKTSFGHVPVYPVLGNHESHPADLYSPTEMFNSRFSTRWLYELVADLWSQWLPEDTRKTIAAGGFYTTLVRPGLRVVALNTNVCYIFNFWLFYNDGDIYGQLRWLVQVLSEAERNGEVVHVLSHIPSGDFTCTKTWSYQLTRILSRFTDTVRAQFNGHTHKLEHTVYFDSNDLSRPGHVAVIGGSLTPWYNHNPNYLVHEIDGRTFEILDYEAWTYRLDEANLTPEREPRWFKLYSFNEAYGTSNVTGPELAKLVRRLAVSRELSQKLNRLKVRDAPLSKPYDETCRIVDLCTMVTSSYGERNHCKIVKGLINN